MKHKKEKGIGFIEVLICLVILVGGIVSTAKLQTYFEVESSNTVLKLHALSLAEQKLKELQHLGANTSDTMQHFYNSVSLTQTVTVKKNTPISGVTDVIVSVSWQDRYGESHEVVLNTQLNEES